MRAERECKLISNSRQLFIEGSLRVELLRVLDASRTNFIISQRLRFSSELRENGTSATDAVLAGEHGREREQLSKGPGRHDVITSSPPMRSPVTFSFRAVLCSSNVERARFQGFFFRFSLVIVTLPIDKILKRGTRLQLILGVLSL